MDAHHSTRRATIGSRQPPGSGYATGMGREDPVEGLSGTWPGARLEPDAAAAGAMAARIFARAGVDLSLAPLPLLVRGTNFQLQVWRALLRIPAGQVVAYGDLARHLGRPGAGRAVGSAVARSPISHVIPCHRVLRASGVISGYRWGVTRKRMMLGREAAQQAAR